MSSRTEADARQRAGGSRAWWLGVSLALAAVLAVLAIAVSAAVEDAAKYDSITHEEWNAMSADDLDAALASGQLSPNAMERDAEDGGNTLLMRAIGEGKKEHFRVLMKRGADVNMVTFASPLIVAAAFGKVEMAAALLKAGANPDFVDYQGDTAAGYAFASYTVLYHYPDDGGITWQQWRAMMDLLLKAGADINAVSTINRGLLTLAVSHCFDKPMVEYLLEKGADANGARNDVFVPLTAAAALNIGTIPTLMDAGADINKASDHKGMTPLQMAVVLNAVDGIRALLAAGADVNAEDGKGNTALAWAYGMEAMRGANFTEYYTAMKNLAKAYPSCDVAHLHAGEEELRRANKEIIGILLAHGAKNTDERPVFDVVAAMNKLFLNGG